MAAWQWTYGFSWLLYSLMLSIWVGVGVINHHHAHRAIWNNDSLNRITELFGAALQGHPVYVFDIAHNNNHHQHNHGPQDLARTYRFGDHNHLVGHVLHPLQVLFVLYPFFSKKVAQIRSNDPPLFRRVCAEYAAVLGVWGSLLYLNPAKALLFVLLPQMVCLHWLLGANYLQHAHADGLSRWNFARNFTGAINWIYFNIGYHTAHHLQPNSHWTEMPATHRRIAHKIHSDLNEPSFFLYVCRVYILGIFVPSLRSRSLMPACGNREAA